LYIGFKKLRNAVFQISNSYVLPIIPWTYFALQPVSLSGVSHASWVSLADSSGIEWHDASSSGAVRYLGYPLYSTQAQLLDYLDAILVKVTRHSNLLKERQLSIRGKSLVANSLLLSKVYHGGHTDTRNCCTITRTGSGLVDDLRYLLMGIFLAAVMFSGYVYPFKWLFPIFKTARNIWNAGDILYNHILLHPVIH
jgi:hypothetical protein